MKTKYVLLILMIAFFIQCTNSKKNDNAVFEKKSESDSCCMKDKKQMDSKSSILSEITCPKCGHKKAETMPVDVCVIKYSCENCKAELYPKAGDCCVFCSYGTHQCPSKQ